MSAPMSVIRFVLTSAVLGFLSFGIVDYATNFEENKCEMTWMYQMPEYIPVPLKASINKQFPRYRLFIYGEGQYADGLRRQMKPRGIPVLFIPGNAGSYRQARSPGSVALRMAEARGTSFHFNYFVVDFNEERAGLYGGSLQAQTEFVHVCIKKILLLYKKAPKPPTSVAIIGHSMGGVVAMALFTLPSFSAQSVTTIITLASPHQAPALLLDMHMQRFYDKINSYWVENRTSIRHVTVMSSSGSYRDLLIREQLTRMNGIADDDRHVSISSIAIPRVWVSMDHLCSVWCRQMVLAIQRAMFDLVNPDTQQISENADFRMSVLRHHFLHHASSSGFRQNWPDTLSLSNKDSWTIHNERLVILSGEKSTKKYHALPTADLQADDRMVIITNVKEDNWLLACHLQEGEKTCSSAENLSPLTFLLPSSKDDSKKVVHLTAGDLEQYDYLVLVMPKTNEKVYMTAEVYESAERHLDYEMPGFMDLITSFPAGLMVNHTMLKPSSHDHALFYNITLHGLSHVLQAYTVQIDITSCADNAPSDDILALVHVPWSNNDAYVRFKSSSGALGTLSLKLHESQPVESSQNSQLHIYVNTACQYKVSIKWAWSEMSGQFIRFCGSLLPAFIVANLLRAFLGQLNVWSSDSDCPTLHKALATYAKPFPLGPVSALIRIMLNVEFIAGYLLVFGIPKDDSHALTSHGIFFAVLPLLLYTSAHLIITLHAVITHYVFIIFTSPVRFLFGRCMASSLMRHIGTALSVLLLLVAAGVSSSVCGAAGLFICYMHQFFKVICLYVLHRDSESARGKVYLHLSLFHLYLWLLILNTPALIEWATNLKFSLVLVNDESRMSTVMVALISLIFSLWDKPSDSSVSRLITFPAYVPVMVLLLYCPYSLHRITYITSSTLLALAVARVILTKNTPDMKKNDHVDMKDEGIIKSDQ